MNSELEVLRDVIGRLEGAGIAYMLTGSVAMSVYAEPRMTRDIDIVVELAPGDTRRVVELFSLDYPASRIRQTRASRARRERRVGHRQGRPDSFQARLGGAVRVRGTVTRCAQASCVGRR